MMTITKKTTPNMNKGRQGHAPDMIVCHITEGSYAGAVSWLANPEAKASSHFVVARDGRITQLVALEDTAWCNGTSSTKTANTWHGLSTLQTVRERNVNANLYTVSIEHEGRHSETQGALDPAQQTAVIALIAHIRAEVKRMYNSEIPLDRLHIVGHNEIAPKTKPHCPGARYPFDAIIQSLKEQEAAPEPVTPLPLPPEPPDAPPAPADPSGTPSNFAREAWEWATKNGITDGTNPRGAVTREQLVTMLHRYHVMTARE
jgi:N-acetyl-anhydromuramyl-L-alanine amidase AmpD